MKLILASASPRRLELLKRMGFTPDEVIPADIDESVRKKEKPEDYVKRVAEEKALKVRDQRPETSNKEFILAADTTVVCANQILGKPEDRADAQRIIKIMCGRKHKVLTAICVISPSGEKRVKLVVTSVKFKNATDNEIEEYLNSNEWVGKAGAYGLQGDSGGFVITINGSFSSVVGLPMYETKNMLLGLGFKR